MAEAATMEVRARLSAETAQFTKGMENARRAADEFTQSSNRLKGAIVGVGVVAGTATAALIGFGIKSFNAAARVDELNIALNAVGKSTGFGYKKLNETALAIESMGIEFEIAQKATLKYAQNNLDLAKASEVARVAQDLAVIGAMNSSDAFDRLTHAIITGRSEVLKSVGIQKSAGAAYAEYGRSIGKAGKDLTATEKQAAVMNLVLEEGARVAGTYEAAMTTPGKVLRSFARLHKALEVSMGKVLIAGFGPLIFETYELYKQFVKAVGGTGAFKNILEALQLVIVKLTTPITAFIKGLGSMIEKMDKAKISTVGLAEAIEFILPVLAGLGAAAAVVAGKQIFALVPVLGSVLGKLSPLPIALLAMATTSTQVRNALGKLIDALRPLLPPLVQLGKIMAVVAGFGVAVLAKAISGLAFLINGAIGLVQRYAGVFKVLGTVIGAIVIGFAAYRTALIVAGAATALYDFYLAAMTFAHLQAIPAVMGLNSALLANPIPLVIGALVALTVAFAAAWKNSESFRNVMTNVFNTVAKVVGKVIGGTLKLFGYLLIAFGNLMDTNNAFGKVVANVLQFVYSAYLTVFIGIAKLVKFVIDAFIALMENQGVLGQVIESVINFIIKAYLTYVKFVVTVVKTVIESFVRLMENNALLRNVVEEVFNSIIRIIALAVTAVVTSFAHILKGVATVIYVFEKMWMVIKTVAGAIIGAIGAMATGIGNIIKKAFSFIVEKFLGALVGKVQDFVDFLAGAAKKIPIVGSAIAGFFSGMSSELERAVTSLKSFGNTAENIGASETSSAKKSVDAISGISNTLITGAKNWGNYSSGAAGALSDIANKMLDFNQKVVDIGAKDNGKTLIDGLVKGAKSALPTLDKLLAGIDEKLEVNFGKAVVDTLVAGAKLASDGLGKMITEMEKLKDIKIGDFIVDNVGAKAVQAGEFLLGLATSIESFTGSNFVGNVGDAFDGLMDKLKEGLGFGDILAKEKKAFEESAPGSLNLEEIAKDMEGQSDYMKRIREAMANGIKGIKDVIQDLSDAAKDFADSLKETIVNFAGLKGVELPDGFIPKAKSLIENMRMRLDKSQQFATQIAQLQSMNLNADSLKAIIEEGPIKGAQLAASILGGGAEAIAEINKLQQAISFTGAAVGQYGADVAYKDLITGAQTRLSQIESASMQYGSAGSNVYVSQGAVQITVDTSAAQGDATVMGDMVVAKIEEIFGILGKELAAK